MKTITINLTCAVCGTVHPPEEMPVVDGHGIVVPCPKCSTTYIIHTNGKPAAIDVDLWLGETKLPQVADIVNRIRDTPDCYNAAVDRLQASEPVFEQVMRSLCEGMPDTYTRSQFIEGLLITIYKDMSALTRGLLIEDSIRCLTELLVETREEAAKIRQENSNEPN